MAPSPVVEQVDSRLQQGKRATNHLTSTHGLPSTLNTKCLAAWQLTQKKCHVYSSKHVNKIYYVAMHPHSTSTKSKTKNETIL
jgi:hypothetical protein